MIVEAVFHAPVEPVTPGDARVSVSIGPCGELVVLWSHPGGFRVTGHFPEPALLAEIPDPDAPYRQAHPLPDGAVLVLGGSADNAAVVDSGGRVLARADLGDDIGHVFTTSTGEVWVGYHDSGFTRGSGPTPHGLVRFGPDLRPAWRFPVGEIADCYALNVTDDDVWTCYYPDFPVVRVKDGRVTRWDSDTRYVQALAVRDRHVGLFGGFGDDRDRLVVGLLEGDGFRVTARHRLALAGGEPLPDDVRVLGRGGALHVVTAGAWFRLDLADLVRR